MKKKTVTSETEEITIDNKKKKRKKEKKAYREIRWDRLDNTAHLFPVIAGLGVSVYGCYKLWKKNKNPKTFVDSWQKTENAAELLDEKTILLDRKSTRLNSSH